MSENGKYARILFRQVVQLFLEPLSTLLLDKKNDNNDKFLKKMVKPV